MELKVISWSLQLPTNGLEWRIPAVKWKPHNNNLIRLLTCPKMLWSWVTSKETQKLKFSNIFKPQRTWKHDNMECHTLFPIWQEHEHYIKKHKQKAAGLHGFVSISWRRPFVWKSPSFRSFDVRIEHSLQQRKSDVPLTAPLVAMRMQCWTKRGELEVQSCGYYYYQKDGTTIYIKIISLRVCW